MKTRQILYLLSGLVFIVAAGFSVYFGANRLAGQNLDESGRKLFNTEWLSALFSGGSGTPLMGEEDDSVNFLLLGIPGDESYDGPALTDTVMLVNYQPERGQVAAFSLPRDLYVNVAGYGKTKLNSVFSIGEVKFNDGAGTLANMVADITGLPIHYFVKVDFAGFEKFIDLLGGVEIDVEEDLYDPAYPDGNFGYELLQIKAGHQFMDGKLALKYVRSRSTTSDFDRALRQQHMIEAVKTKAESLGLLDKLSKIFDVYSLLRENVETNLKWDEIKHIVSLAKDFEMSEETIYNKVFDDSAGGFLYADRIDEQYVLLPNVADYSEIRNFVEEVVTSESFKITEINLPALRVQVLNGTSVTGLAGKQQSKVEGLGFEMVSAANSPTRSFTQSEIYDYTDGSRDVTVNKLVEAYNAKLVKKDSSADLGYDLQLVVGTDATL